MKGNVSCLIKLSGYSKCDERRETMKLIVHEIKTNTYEKLYLDEIIKVIQGGDYEKEISVIRTIVDDNERKLKKHKP